MAKVERFDTTDGKLGFIIMDCPGCGENHLFTTGFTNEEARQKEVDRRLKHFMGAPHQPCPIWNFNGSLDWPTFTPSMLLEHTVGDPPRKVRCHLYVTDGRLAFLSDCTHGLAGQTVDLPECE